MNQSELQLHAERERSSLERDNDRLRDAIRSYLDELDSQPGSVDRLVDRTRRLREALYDRR